MGETSQRDQIRQARDNCDTAEGPHAHARITAPLATLLLTTNRWPQVDAPPAVSRQKRDTFPLNTRAQQKRVLFY